MMEHAEGELDNNALTAEARKLLEELASTTLPDGRPGNVGISWDKSRNKMGYCVRLKFLQQNIMGKGCHRPAERSVAGLRLALQSAKDVRDKLVSDLSGARAELNEMNAMHQQMLLDQVKERPDALTDAQVRTAAQLLMNRHRANTPATRPALNSREDGERRLKQGCGIAWRNDKLAFEVKIWRDGGYLPRRAFAVKRNTVADLREAFAMAKAAAEHMMEEHMEREVVVQPTLLQAAMGQQQQAVPAIVDHPPLAITDAQPSPAAIKAVKDEKIDGSSDPQDGSVALDKCAEAARKRLSDRSVGDFMVAEQLRWNCDSREYEVVECVYRRHNWRSTPFSAKWASVGARVPEGEGGLMLMEGVVDEALNKAAKAVLLRALRRRNKDRAKRKDKAV
ncbi:unnamed protein product [Vitrella brassicaformis CCMP3155]|uniref:Uncharacterized protein n=1 Tax=Vitrella brassicaformis (strain CCMP3155) TaxID=1169540 RepID=A0A0G4EB18_VITBC|nr:unnamed protein product [Vitrella brassicaformis CCMP3155]|eukprot:CEL92879.1 unnamed protein product [Vitrella brassicaformis CCMP3155]